MSHWWPGCGICSEADAPRKKAVTMSLFPRFRDDERGATAIEYGLIAGIIAIAIVAGASIFTSRTAEVFQIIGTAMEAATD